MIIGITRDASVSYDLKNLPIFPTLTTEILEKESALGHQRFLLKQAHCGFVSKDKLVVLSEWGMPYDVLRKIQNARDGLLGGMKRVVVPDELKKQVFDPNALPLVRVSEGVCRIPIDGNPFRGTLRANSQMLWGANEEITKTHVQELVHFLLPFGHSIHINTGTHGSLQGHSVCQTQNATSASSRILQEDLKIEGTYPNVSIHIVSSYSSEIYPIEANHIINGWCYAGSANANSLPKHASTAPGLSLLAKCSGSSPQKAPPQPTKHSPGSAPVQTKPQKQPFPSPIPPVATKTSSSATAILTNTPPSLLAISAIAFDKAKWQTYFGDIGVEPPLPPNIHQILSSPCPFWPGKTIQETHLLVLVPSHVNGQPLTLQSLGELVKRPKQGHATQYREWFPGYNENTHTAKTHWVLMTKDVIPDSRNKLYNPQVVLVREYVTRSGYPYEVPHLIEAATVLFMHHVKTGERLYGDNPRTFTRCQEMRVGATWPVIIGDFAANGLIVHDVHCGIGVYVGIGALWQL